MPGPGRGCVQAGHGGKCSRERGARNFEDAMLWHAPALRSIREPAIHAIHAIHFSRFQTARKRTVTRRCSEEPGVRFSWTGGPCFCHANCRFTNKALPLFFLKKGDSFYKKARISPHVEHRKRWCETRRLRETRPDVYGNKTSIHGTFSEP